MPQEEKIVAFFSLSHGEVSQTAVRSLDMLCGKRRVLELLPESGLGFPPHLTSDLPWLGLGLGLDAEAETPVLWPPVVKNRLVGKDPDAGKD